MKIAAHRAAIWTASGPEGMRRTRRCAGSVLPQALSGPARDGSLRPGSPGIASRDVSVLLRKEVIQPQVPLRLPCYDFIPITTHTLDTCPLSVGAAALGADGFHDVTGGVYKARERIHGAVADAPLLANPTSCSRVADCNLNWGRLWGFAPPRGIAPLCTGHCSTCAAPDVRALLT